MNLTFEPRTDGSKPLPQYIGSDNLIVQELDPQTPLVQPGDFVMGVMIRPCAKEEPIGTHLVEVWGPAEMATQEQSFRTRWWGRMFLIGIGWGATAFLIGHWWALR